MNLKKTLILASMALAAFSVPGAAQAQDHGLFEEDVSLEDTAPVTLTSTNLKTENGLGTATCEKVTLHYDVEHNGNDGNNVLLGPHLSPQTQGMQHTRPAC